ncbi:MAG: hypothetical protein KAS05_03520, partial [Candidatus Omnitrophica bacterium]|nr:hypothetical protein [Candidatus Omnitrophota bacterium]
MPCFDRDVEYLEEGLKRAADETKQGVIYCGKDEKGEPFLEFNGNRSATLKLRTLKLSVERKKNLYFVRINNNAYIIPDEHIEQAVFVLSTKWFSLRRGERRDLEEIFSPDSRSLLMEGIGATANPRLNAHDWVATVNFHCNFDSRWVRVLIRARDEARGMSEDELLYKRIVIQRTEEAPYVIPWLKGCKIVCCTNSLAEAIFEHYKNARLKDFDAPLYILGLKAEEIEKKLSFISFERIKSIIEEGRFIIDSAGEGCLKKVYTNERGNYGLVLIFPVRKGEFCQEEGVFSEKFKRLNAESNDRLGRLKVGNKIYDISEYGRTTLPLGKEGIHRVKEVLVKNNVYVSLEHVLDNLNKSEAPDKTTKIRHLFDMVFRLRQDAEGEGREYSKDESLFEAISRRGETGRFSFKDIAFRLVINDRTGEEVIIVNEDKGLTRELSEYDPENYSLEKMTELQFSKEEVDYYNKLISRLPNKKTFEEKYFNKGIKDCRRVSEPFDKDSIVKKIEALTKEVEQLLLDILYNYYAEEKERARLNKTESFFVWLRLYKRFLEEQERQTEERREIIELLGRLYEEAEKSPEMIEDGRWQDVLENLAKGSIGLGYRELKRIEFFERSRKDIQHGGAMSSPIVNKPSFSSSPMELAYSSLFKQPSVNESESDHPLAIALKRAGLQRDAERILNVYANLRDTDWAPAEYKKFSGLVAFYAVSADGQPLNIDTGRNSGAFLSAAFGFRLWVKEQEKEQTQGLSRRVSKELLAYHNEFFKEFDLKKSASPINNAEDNISSSALVITEYGKLKQEVQEAIEESLIQWAKQQGFYGARSFCTFYFKQNCLLAIRDNHVIGFLKFSILESWGEGIVKNIGVFSSRCGIGRKLVQYCFENKFSDVKHITSTYFLPGSAYPFWKAMAGEENIEVIDLDEYGKKYRIDIHTSSFSFDSPGQRDEEQENTSSPLEHNPLAISELGEGFNYRELADMLYGLVAQKTVLKKIFAIIFENKNDYENFIASGSKFISGFVEENGRFDFSNAVSSPINMEGLLFRPKIEFKYGTPLTSRVIRQQIIPTMSARQVRMLLMKAKEEGIELSIKGHLRGVDGPGSSLDLPEFQIRLTKQGAKSIKEYPSTPTIASEFSIKIRFELADDPEAIEYAAPDYGITTEKPLKIKKIKLDKNGRIVEAVTVGFFFRNILRLLRGKAPLKLNKNAQALAPAFILNDLFGLKGIRVICIEISPMALAGGMESSSTFNVALLAAGSMFSGAGLSMADIFSLAVKMEKDELGGLSGGQGHLCCMLGGAYQHIWLSGQKDTQGNLINPCSALSIPLLTTEESLRAIEERILLVQAGKPYKDGKAQVERVSSLTNNMWTDLLRDKDEIGLPLHQEKLPATVTFAKALKEGDFLAAYLEVVKYVQRRDQLCRRWLSLAIDAHKEIDGLAAHAYKYARKVWDSGHSDYEEFELVRNMYEQMGDELKNVSLYTLDPIENLIREALKYGIAIMPLGAGGPGANLMAISVKGVEHMKAFLEGRNIKLLDEEEVRLIMRGTGELKGYMPFKTGKGPLKIAGFRELGLKLLQGPEKVIISTHDITKLSSSPLELSGLKISIKGVRPLHLTERQKESGSLVKRSVLDSTENNLREFLVKLSAKING